MECAAMQKFELRGVEPTGRKLGSGSYGSVVEVRFNHILCAAKELHEDLLFPPDEGYEAFLKKYQRECELMAKLRHPHIVQFMGVCYFSPDQNIPLLVMEKLETSLHCMLETVPNLPLLLRISWLENVCYGLSYLHRMSPPVIHRDLSASNVLLSSFLVAKISDVGNSRIVELNAGQVAKTLTRQPGTLVYMPPESLDESHRYGPSLDVFSFGQLSLFTFIQEFPWNLKSPTYPASSESEGIIGRSEIERREDYMERLEHTMRPGYPGLISIVKRCLQNKPEKRPSVSTLLKELGEVKEKLIRVHGEDSIDVNAILARKNMAEQKEAVKDLKKKNDELQELLKVKEKTISQTEEELKKKEKELVKTQKQVSEGQQLLHEKTAELEKVKEKYDSVTSQLRDMEVERLHWSLERSSETSQPAVEPSEDQVKERIQRMEEQLHDCKKLLRLVKGIKDGDQPLEIDWTAGKVMPRPTGGYVQAVVLGDTVFVTGGFLSHKDVMVYHVPSQEWLQSLQYTLVHFSLAVLSDQLVLVGGGDLDSISSELGVWDANEKKWVRPYTAMPTPRVNASVATYRNYLVVAGGCSKVFHPRQQNRKMHHQGAGPGSEKGRLLSVCEILDSGTNQWHSTVATPIPWTCMKCVVIGDTFYALGGHTIGCAMTDAMYYTSVLDLISQTSSADASVWKAVKISCSVLSIPCDIGGRLHVCGGLGCGSIRRYLSETEEWIEVGKMPLAVGKAAMVRTRDGKLFLAGGCRTIGRPLDLMHIGSF